MEIVLLGTAPVRLALLTASSGGAISTRVRIPSDTPGGEHELTAVGYTPFKSLHELASPVTVTRSSPPRPPSKCVGTLSGTFHDLTVAQNMVCTLVKATVDGSIKVDRGAVFEAESSTVNGNVIARLPQAFQLCGDHVKGDVRVSSPALPPLIGGANSPGCAPTHILGTTTIHPHKLVR